MKRVLGRCAKMLRNCSLHKKSEDATSLERLAENIEERSSRSQSLTWEQLLRAAATRGSSF
jgi:hypothetical protein